MSFLSFFLGNRIGRYLTFAAVGAVAVLILIRYGGSLERQKAAVDALRGTVKTLEERREKEREVSNLSRGELDDRLSRWLRDT